MDGSGGGWRTGRTGEKALQDTGVRRQGQRTLATDGAVLAEKSRAKSDLVLEGPPADDMEYEARDAANMPNWPDCPLGDTAAAYLQGTALATVQRSGTAGLRLTGRLNMSQFRSCGVAEGEHAWGSYVPRQDRRERPGPWDRSLDSISVKWSPRPPDDGVLPVVLVVDRALAERVAVAERQHISDHRLAHTLSWGVLERAITDVGEVAVSGNEWQSELLGRLTDALLKQKAGYLIPKAPDAIDQWGPQLTDVHQQLVGQSQRRDAEGWHDPKGVTATVTGGVIRIRLTPGDDLTDSSAVVRPELLTKDFTHADYRTYIESRSAAGRFAKGDRVRLAPGVSLDVVESTLTATAHGDDMAWDPEFVATRLGEGGTFDSTDPRTERLWISLGTSGSTEYANRNAVFVAMRADSVRPVDD